MVCRLFLGHFGWLSWINFKDLGAICVISMCVIGVFLVHPLVQPVPTSWFRSAMVSSCWAYWFWWVSLLKKKINAISHLIMQEEIIWQGILFTFSDGDLRDFGPLVATTWSEFSYVALTCIIQIPCYFTYWLLFFFKQVLHVQLIHLIRSSWLK